jgi:hypothetical protein
MSRRSEEAGCVAAIPPEASETAHGLTAPNCRYLARCAPLVGSFSARRPATGRLRATRT